jgi:hypothetical protein
MIESLPRIHEIGREATPFPEPQGLAAGADRLYISSRKTRRLYGLDPRRLTVVREIEPPGMPWGITLRGETIVAACGEGPDDDRYLHEYDGAGGWSAGTPCPDLTGSYLACNSEDTLYLTQWYNRSVLQLSADGQVVKSWTAPHEICGACFRDGTLYLVTTDDEYTSAYYLTRADLDTAQFSDVAAVLFPARSLAWNGSEFLTNHREKDEIVRFTLDALT